MNNEKIAEVRYAGDDLFIGISPSGHATTIDTNSQRNAAATPMEMLLTALGACTGVDVVHILEKKREQVTAYRMEVRGVRRDEHPRAWTRIEVKHILHGRNLSERAVAQAIQLSDEKYCSVAATIRGVTEIVTTYEIVQEQAPGGA